MYNGYINYITICIVIYVYVYVYLNIYRNMITVCY